MRNIGIILPALIFSAVSCINRQEAATLELKEPAEYVDPFIGTSYHGHVFPGATVPFGMVQLSPDNGTSGWDWCSGYHYSDSLIAGFGHTHLSGTGIGDLADIVFLPSMEEFKEAYTDDRSSVAHENRSSFSHDNEEAEPGYYSVKLDNGVSVSLTATRRAGFQKYRAERDGVMNILVDLGFAINWDSPVDCSLEYDGEVLRGKRISTGWAERQYQYFASLFSKEPDTVRIVKDGMFNDRLSVEGEKIGIILSFNVARGEEILVKTGLSAVDEKGAEQNLRTEIPGWDFEEVKKAAYDEWNRELSVIKAASTDDEILKVFYTALYHSFIAPNTYSDYDGRYRGADLAIHRSDSFTNYTVFSLWDTFRAAHPLFTIVQSDRVPDMINAMLNIYLQQGKLPVWSLMANETNTMIGYHAVPVIADAMKKGIEGFDYELAYQAAKHSSMLDFEGLDSYRRYNYIPANLENESVSKTLEYCYDDWCIAQMAYLLGKDDDYRYYMRRANYYKNLFDAETGFMRGKLSGGSWKIPFDPLYSSHRQDEYTEGNAWQYTWFVPHDLYGLASLMGGTPDLIIKLDSLFLQEEGVTGENASSDISGLIGAYAHGNEPGHHTTYIFSSLGKPRRTQELVRRIMTEMYHPGKDGLCGNEDCGQMSAWYVFSAMGFYPLNPADGMYIFGSPLLDEAVIKLPGDKEFIIKTKNNGPENIYVKSISLNGESLERNYIRHDQIMDGGTLVFEMSNK
ncbi:MAG TPA: glycoside hydrolase family 92 protein [Bacteroidetes bacterium]|nr:glycoside hydrolase family 92 protein [Bacteroidota bacterium]